jgi:hypothetical protein
MPVCVSDASYNVLFVFSICLVIIFLALSAYSYDGFNKTENNIITPQQARQAKIFNMVGIIIACLGIAVMFLLFFGFRHKLVGVYAKVSPGPTNVPAF